MQSPDAQFDPLNEQNLTKSLSLVKAVAGEIHRRLPRAVEYDDLYQNGVLGLMEAVKKYDPSKGVPFRPYAKFRIRGAILDALRKGDLLTRHQRQQLKKDGAPDFPIPVLISSSAPRLPDGSESTSIEATLPSGPSSSPYRMFQTEEAARLLASAMEDLPPRHRHLLHLLYNEDLRAREVARRFQVNESRVSQMRGSALRKISAKLEQHGLKREHFLEAAS